jgi:DNA-binding HxlR family transcriptional regulator
MASAYGQFCPVAKAMELLDERWTILVVRELSLGSRHFNALRRGLPRMSPALLSKRLQMLARCGVVERHQEGNRITYHLTEAGRELTPIVMAIGAWGVRWIDELGDEDLDPHLLMWDMHRNVDLEAVPDATTEVAFVFPDVEPAKRRSWMVIRRDGVDVCDFDPGHPVWATVTAPLRLLTRVHRGDITWDEAFRDGLRIDGGTAARRALPRWLRPSGLAGVPRPEVSDRVRVLA